MSEPPTPFQALIDNRRYAWMVGVLAAVLVIGFLIYALTTHPSGSGTPGVAAGPAASRLRGAAGRV